MIEIRLPKRSAPSTRDASRTTIFASQFLMKRPLLQAIDPDDGVPPVLLIDELDRTDEPFEAYLLEVLSDFQVSIPELGVIARRHPAVVVITSNRHARDPRRDQAPVPLSLDRLPDALRELEIVRRKCPHAPERSRARVVAFTAALAQDGSVQVAGVAETLDWAEALIAHRPPSRSIRDCRRHARRAAQVSGRHRRDCYRIGGEDRGGRCRRKGSSCD
jgi:MoxR-like ATPase